MDGWRCQSTPVSPSLSLSLSLSLYRLFESVNFSTTTGAGKRGVIGSRGKVSRRRYRSELPTENGHEELTASCGSASIIHPEQTPR